MEVSPLRLLTLSSLLPPPNTTSLLGQMNQALSKAKLEEGRKVIRYRGKMSAQGMHQMHQKHRVKDQPGCVKALQSKSELFAEPCITHTKISYNIPRKRDVVELTEGNYPAILCKYVVTSSLLQCIRSPPKSSSTERAGVRSGERFPVLSRDTETPQRGEKRQPGSLALTHGWRYFGSSFALRWVAEGVGGGGFDAS